MMKHDQFTIDRQINRQSRISGIEALKVIATIMVVIGHTVQTLHARNTLVSYNDYFVDISTASTNVQIIILQILHSFGMWANNIFFVCSAWFLLDSNRNNKRKWLFMVVEIWSVSVIISIITYILRHGDVSLSLLVKCAFPTTFSANWYLTCYLLFYPIHPLLNKLINALDKKTHLRASLGMFIIYACFVFVNGELFFPSYLLLWISIYFVIGYMKKHMTNLSNNMKSNVIAVVITVLSFFAFDILTNIAGLRITSIKNQMLRWSTTTYNPFFIISSLAMLNIARNMKFRSKTINNISGLSMLIYIIHENLLLRTYFRPYLLHLIYNKFGYDHVVLLVIALAFAIFVASMICAVLYSLTFKKLVKTISGKLYGFLKSVYLQIEKWMLSMLK